MNLFTALACSATRREEERKSDFVLAKAFALVRKHAKDLTLASDHFPSHNLLPTNNEQRQLDALSTPQIFRRVQSNDVGLFQQRLFNVRRRWRPLERTKLD